MKFAFGLMFFVLCIGLIESYSSVAINTAVAQSNSMRKSSSSMEEAAEKMVNFIQNDCPNENPPEMCESFQGDVVSFFNQITEFCRDLHVRVDAGEFENNITELDILLYGPGPWPTRFTGSPFIPLNGWPKKTCRDR